MSIIRVVHNKENPFVQLNKESLWNPNLSLKAVGLWARCMSRPDDWKFNILELSKKCKEGRRSIDSAIKELMDENYAIRIEHNEKDEHGKFSNKDYEYVFFEFPVSESEKLVYIDKFKKCFRDCGFGNLRGGNIQNSTLLISNLKEKDLRKEKEREGGKPPVPPTPKLFEYKKVKMGFEKYEELLKELGESKTKEMLERLDEYGEMKPKRFKEYACHYTVIKKWVRDDSQKPSYSKKGLSPANVALGAQVKARFGDHPHIHVSDQGIMFHGGQEQTFIKYEDHGFREQVLSRLRKMGLDIGGL